jgi:type IV pilus assembly protein PilA
LTTCNAKGFTLVELLIVVAIIGIIATIAAPNLLRVRMSGNEASALASLKAINSAQVIYSTTCAAGGYAVDLADLVLPATGTRQSFLSPDLSANGVTKSGYTVTLAMDAAAGVFNVISPAGTCNASAGQPVSSYFAKADPVSVGTTGTRYFATDTRGTIFFATGATLANPIPAGSIAIR